MIIADHNEEEVNEIPLIPRKRKNKSAIGSTIVIVLALAILIVAGWFAFGQSDFFTGKSSQSLDLSDQPNGKLLERVGKHIVLPVGETPSVTDITDIDTLVQQQSFYIGAKNGDKIIFYPDSQKTIIYDEANDILVNVRSVSGFAARASSTDLSTITTSTTTESSNTPDQVVAKLATLEIRNGTTKTGWAKTNSNLFTNSPIFTVTKVLTATKTNYPVTIVVNQKNVDVSTLENRYEVVATGKMPAGEAPSDADVVLILGLK